MLTGITCLHSDRKPHSISSINPPKNCSKLQSLSKGKAKDRTRASEEGGPFSTLALERVRTSQVAHSRGKEMVSKPSTGSYKFGVKIPNITKFRAQFGLSRAQIVSDDRTARNILFSSGICSLKQRQLYHHTEKIKLEFISIIPCHETEF